MVTVTLPIRAAVAPQPERSPPPVPDGAGATGFEAVFALLTPAAEPPDRSPPTADDVPEQDATSAEDALSDEERECKEEAAETACPEPAQVPVQPALRPRVETDAISATAGSGTDTADPLTGGQAIVQNVTSLLSAPAKDAVVAVLSSLPPAIGQTAALVAAQLAGDDNASGGSDDGAVETGLFILAEETGTISRTPALPTGMPAFWAAREAATTAQVMPSAPAPGDASSASPDLEAPKPIAPKPAETLLTWDEILPLEGGEVQGLPEARSMTTPSTPQSLLIGQSQPTQSQTTPQSALPPSMPPHLPAQLAAAIAARPERPLELRLAPVELGGLTLNLRQDGDILRVVLQADRPETLDLLRRNGDVLLEELRLAGFAGASLSFADGGGPQDQQAPADVPSGPISEIPVLSAPIPPSTSAQPAQGLDLRL